MKTFADLKPGTTVNYRDMANDITAVVVEVEKEEMFGDQVKLIDEEGNFHYAMVSASIQEKNSYKAGWRVIE